ncbi:MAG: hypothetical protein AB7V15_04295, partial [Acidimicrobiia bacterium]
MRASVVAVALLGLAACGSDTDDVRTEMSGPSSIPFPTDAGEMPTVGGTSSQILLLADSKEAGAQWSGKSYIYDRAE